MDLITGSRVLLAVSLLVTGWFQDCSGGPEGVALGETARERVSLTATANQIVVALPVPEGATVDAGTVLVQLDDRIQKANVALAEARLASAQAALDKLVAGARPEEIAVAEANVAAKKAELREAESVYERDRRLVEADAVTVARLEADEARRDAARAALSAAEQSLKELRVGAREEDLRRAEADADAARAALEAEQARLAELTITASRGGVLDSLPWNLGERVTVGSPVAVVLAGEAPQARVYIPEAHRVGLKEGDRLPVHVDGLPEPLTGVVRWISSDPAFTPYYALNQEERGRLVYRADILLPDADPDLPLGIPVQVDMP
ncbi:HlyD family secretion protein [Pseudoruegeria sp. SHC-113]|uniref:HlyD family secretion protein n=1 Tax=Pseudoruegeria sp. SHC-113 TaxID=2855439 RepID=UPI0021BB68BD|nr:HlyD family efflux transporter periplasmic adaptor subunit [Pseudoruegeria sp. SHC-113]MCT8161787.1 HlyD family efflux transporter periplasmic adaptor subunit [Pseudoruegeria sp. SHC-113]